MMLSLGVPSKLYIQPHQGLGDHILCSGLYRQYAKKFKLCVLPVYKKNYFAVKDLLKDVKNIQVLSHSEWIPTFELNAIFLEKMGFQVLRLGGFTGEDIPLNTRFDNWFYNQAKIEFKERWDSYNYVRNTYKEEELYKSFGLEPNTRYAFIHEDIKRDYRINYSFIDSGLKIISADPKIANKFTPFHYQKVIENASEIHCIESSFCAMIESMKDLRIRKFAHRYSRPEAKSDFRQEFTYKTDWEILN